jgi:hypothetical protein
MLSFSYLSFCAGFWIFLGMKEGEFNLIFARKNKKRAVAPKGNFCFFSSITFFVCQNEKS